MTKALKKGIFSAIAFLAYAIAMEVFIFIYFGWGVMPEYFLLDLGIMLFIAIVIFLIPWQWLRNVVSALILTLQLVISYANICIMRNISSIFIFDMFTLVKETAQVIEPGVFVLWPLGVFIPLVLSYVSSIIFISLIKTTREENKIYSKHVDLYFLTLSLVFSFSLYSFEYGHIMRSQSLSEEQVSDASLFESFYVGSTSLEKFGTYGFYFEDLFRRMLGIKSEGDITPQQAQAQLESREYEPQDQLLYGVCQGDNLIVIMAESFEWYAITPEMTPVLFSLANGVDLTKLNVQAGEYFYSFTPNEDGTQKVERTELSYDDLLPEQVGLSLVNYHSKAKTDYSEHSVVLGGYPFKNTYSNIISLYENNDYGFTLPSKLHSQGYDTTYFHTWLKDFYNRENLNKRFGFDNLMFIEDMEKMENYHGDLLRLGSKDSAFMQLYYDEFTHKDYDGPFMSFFTSVSTHGSYEYNPYLGDMYDFVNASPWLKVPEDAEVDSKLWNGYMETYLAGVVDMEQMVAYLVYNLILDGELDNTTIVFYADHNSFYYDADLVYKPLFYSDYYVDEMGESYYWAQKSGLGLTYGELDPNRYAVPAFIYSTKITSNILSGKSHYVPQFVEAYDLTATIMTLFGVQYMPGGYMGYPIYCVGTDGEELYNNIIMSQNSGVFSDKIYSLDGSTISYAHPDVTEAEQTKFKQDASKFYDKWRKINAIYQYNLFANEKRG